MYAHHRGPRRARPRYHDAPPDTGRSHWDGPSIGALLYGPRETGGCGVEQLSALDRELREWVSSAGDGKEDKRTAGVLAVERKLRKAMRLAGMLRPRVDVPRVRRHTYPDGTTMARVCEGRENSPCASVQEVLTLP